MLLEKFCNHFYVKQNAHSNSRNKEVRNHTSINYHNQGQYNFFLTFDQLKSEMIWVLVNPTFFEVGILL